MLEQAYTSFRDMILYISSQLHIQWRKVCSMKLTKWVYFHHKNYPLFLPAPQESVYQHTSGIMWSSAQIHNLTIPVGSQSENWSREETCCRRKRLWGKPSTPLEISNNSRVGALSSWPPHLEALLSSLCALFIPLPLPAKICTHCLTFTQLSRITRPSPIFFHSPKQHQYQGQKRNHLELQNQTFSPSSSCLTWSPRAPKAQVYLLHSSPSSPSSPHPAERFCKPIWKFLIWNLYSRLSSMCTFAYPECSSYCLLNQRAVNQSDPQQ